jgi:nitrate reductase alpha subunit
MPRTPKIIIRINCGFTIPRTASLSAGATYPWYTYSPMHLKYPPPMRACLLEMGCWALARYSDPVPVWEEMVAEYCPACRGESYFANG